MVVCESVPSNVSGNASPSSVLNTTREQVFQVYLVTYPGVRRDNFQRAERLLAPTEETVPLPVALELEVRIAGEGIGAAGEVGNNGVVDHELGRHLGLDGGRIPAEGNHGIAHGSQVGDHRDTGEVLHEYPGRGERDLRSLRLAPCRPGRRRPRRQRGNALRGHIQTVFVTEQVLEEDLQREGEAADFKAFSSELVQPVDGEGPHADQQVRVRPETVT